MYSLFLRKKTFCCDFDCVYTISLNIRFDYIAGRMYVPLLVGFPFNRGRRLAHYFKKGFKLHSLVTVG